MAEGGYVVVTIADNGVVHAWGTGVHPEPGQPFPSRAQAAASVRKARRENIRNGYGERQVTYKVCKLLASDTEVQ